VNLGGGESRFIHPGVNSNYGNQILKLIIQLKPHFNNKEIVQPNIGILFSSII
jgi:hypothetical protein